MPRKYRRTLKDYLLPHRGNSYKPILFTAGGVAVLVLGLLLVQAAYVLQTSVVFAQTNFLASVLPGVLSTLANEDRTRNGVSTLAFDPLLAEAAQLKAADMAEKGYFAHVDPSGRAPWFWLDQVGYQYTYAGENLAVDFKDSKDVQDAWMNSPTHRANIVKPQYTRIGIGTAEGEYKGRATTFVVQFFATPRSGGLGDSMGLGSLGAESSEGRVLGAETESFDARIMSVLAQIATSPTHTVIYVLSGLIVLFSLLLLVAVVMHVRIQYLEVICGGLLVIFVAAALLIYNVISSSSAAVPESGEESAVEAAF